MRHLRRAQPVNAETFVLFGDRVDVRRGAGGRKCSFLTETYHLPRWLLYAVAGMGCGSLHTRGYRWLAAGPLDWPLALFAA